MQMTDNFAVLQQPKIHDLSRISLSIVFLNGDGRKFKDQLNVTRDLHLNEFLGGEERKMKLKMQ